MKLLSLLIIFILFLKVSYIFFELKVLHLKKNGKQDTIEYKNAIYWRDRIEFIFVCCMAILLIYLFNPREIHHKIITNEERILIYLFGWVLLITADWARWVK